MILSFIVWKKLESFEYSNKINKLIILKRSDEKISRKFRLVLDTCSFCFAVEAKEPRRLGETSDWETHKKINEKKRKERDGEVSTMLRTDDDHRCASFLCDSFYFSVVFISFFFFLTKDSLDTFERFQKRSLDSKALRDGINSGPPRTMILRSKDRTYELDSIFAGTRKRQCDR